MMREMRSELGGGLVCYECQTFWPTEAALIADHNSLLVALGEMVETDTTDDIYSCPHCAHDF